jgi:hypothetical protein
MIESFDFDISQIMQTPQAIVKVDEHKNIGIILKDWDVEEEAAYSVDEAQQLIKILQDALSIVNKYNSANETLPLFEGSVNDAQQKTNIH